MASELCIVTAFDEKYRDMGRLCQQSVNRYGLTHHIDTRFVREFKSGRPAAWEKIQVIYELLKEGYQHVCWIDADAAFVRFDVDIRDEIHRKDFYLVVGEHVEPRVWTGGGGFHRADQPCTGFLIVRNCDWSNGFLADWWRRIEFLNHCWWDLAAYIQLCGIHHQYDSQMRDRGVRELLALVDARRPSRPADELAEHIGRLDAKWNCTDQSAASAGLNPMVRHYTGHNGPFAKRLALMERDVANKGVLRADEY